MLGLPCKLHINANATDNVMCQAFATSRRSKVFVLCWCCALVAAHPRLGRLFLSDQLVLCLSPPLVAHTVENENPARAITPEPRKAKAQRAQCPFM